ncbi:DUF6409 family protein [Kitasatospora sp. NPDC101801]|uniref:DUF6409 family protein n=1 Tax=Kitasatospora sp. NPDC101801 TaxID=3364103 RepID=UPI0037F190C4
MPELTATATEAPSKALPPGTVIRCQHVRQGRKLGQARAVVLGRFGTGETAPYRVWFYTKGPARQGDDATVSLSFPHEITVRGPLADQSERVLGRIVRGTHLFDDAAEVWRLASTLQVIKRAQRRG